MRSTWPIAALVSVFVLYASADAARAAGVVGTGSADSCTNAALDAALQGGGLVTFNCGGPATIDITTDTADGERIASKVATG